MECTVIIDSKAEPYTQPSFTLNLGGNGAQFSETISLYVAGIEEITWGSLSSNTYTIPLRNADGMFLDNTDNEFYVILRYKGNPSPVTTITTATS